MTRKDYSPEGKVWSTFDPEMKNQIRGRKNSYWSKRTNLERQLLILSVLSVSICVLLATTVIVITIEISSFIKITKPFLDIKSKVFNIFGGINMKKLANEIQSQVNVCVTPGCIKAAARINSYIDNSTNPCEDFYRFSCGKWIDEQMIPDEKTRVSSWTKSIDDIALKAKALSAEKIKESDPQFILNYKLMYKKCMDVKAIDKLGIQPLSDLLEQLGGWPMASDDWEPEDSQTGNQLQNLISTLSDLGYPLGSLYGVSIGQSIKNPLQNVIAIYEPSLITAREYLVGQDEFSRTKIIHLKELFENVVSYLAGKPKSQITNLDKDIDELFEFEKNVAELKMSREIRRLNPIDKLYQQMTFGEFKRNFSSKFTNWNLILNLKTNEKIQDKEMIEVWNPKFFEQFENLVLSSNPRILVNLLLWDVVRTSSKFLNRDIREIFFRHSQKMTGIEFEPPRWQQCVSVTKALGHSFVIKYFNKNSFKVKVSKMASQIKSSFVHMINSSSWMDFKTKDSAIDKANKMDLKLGYPDQYLDPKIFEKYYQDLVISPNSSYFGAFFETIPFGRKKLWKKWRKPIDPNDWELFPSPLTVNAYQEFLHNRMIFPAGILGGVFYDMDNPPYLNFGSIGSVIGHEITHGFDDKGKQFNGIGKNNNWWDKSTNESFTTKAKCFIDKFSQYYVTDSKGDKHFLKGLIGQGENIADDGGVRASLAAYRKHVMKNGEDKKLPSLTDYNQEQLFWISFAQTWCNKEREKSTLNQIKTGTHSIGQFRVVGVVSNSQDFAHAFKCPIGMKMNPASDKCRIW